MTQAFTVVQGNHRKRFTIQHRLRIRSTDDYARAFERAGFEIVALLPFYPGTPPEQRHEQRLIFVARRGDRLVAPRPFRCAPTAMGS